jgi:hypothetical protein
MIKRLWGALRQEVAAYNLERKQAKEPKPEAAPKLLAFEYDDRFEIMCADGRVYSFLKDMNTSDASLFF